MEKDNTKIAYQLARIIGSPLFKHYYNPTIIDSDFIPEEGPIILCGNHLHVWDQFPVIVSTKRTTHWMAKKEYFDGKMGPFFKMTGAICVDRGHDTSSAKEKTESLLNLGSAIGIFPEGTRNGLKNQEISDLYDITNKKVSFADFKESVRKVNPRASQIQLLTKLYKKGYITKNDMENYIYCVDTALNEMKNLGIITDSEYDDSLLLPFKYGAVSMASKTSAKIVPFAVNGNYVVGNNNLIVRFGEAFNVDKNNLEAENNKLRNKILTLTKENLNKNKSNY